jgi:hypothetical protein
MRSVVKVQWSKDSGEWLPCLLLASDGGFESLELRSGEDLDLELADERRCTGYSSGVGEREPCPGFRGIDSGSQCAECRNRDVYSDYVRGEGSVNQDYVDTVFSVYMAQAGTGVKVGVTRSEKVERRWVEQGADRAVELRRGITSEEALELEDEVSDRFDVSQTVNKSQKVDAGSREEFEDAVGRVCAGISMRKPDTLEVCTDVAICQGFDCQGGLERSGLLPSPLEAVKGQVVSGGGLCVALGSGRVLKQPEQQSLSGF